MSIDHNVRTLFFEMIFTFVYKLLDAIHLNKLLIYYSTGGEQYHLFLHG
jgi:hypothetical protein